MAGLKSTLVGIEPDDFNDGRLQWILVRFATDILALPPRTRRKLLPTIVRISRQPGHFLAHSEKYDPEAAALVLDNLKIASRTNEALLLWWDAGDKAKNAETNAEKNAKNVKKMIREVRAAAKRVAKTPSQIGA